MELEITNNSGVYVSEFEVNSDFNLHVERKDSGIIHLFQRTTSSGDYAVIKEFSQNDAKVIDIDITGAIYPKYIKLVSFSEITFGEITSKE